MERVNLTIIVIVISIRDQNTGVRPNKPSFSAGVTRYYSNEGYVRGKVHLTVEE